MPSSARSWATRSPAPLATDGVCDDRGGDPHDRPDGHHLRRRKDRDRQCRAEDRKNQVDIHPAKMRSRGAFVNGDLPDQPRSARLTPQGVASRNMRGPGAKGALTRQAGRNIPKL